MTRFIGWYVEKDMCHLSAIKEGECGPLSPHGPVLSDQEEPSFQAYGSRHSRPLQRVLRCYQILLPFISYVMLPKILIELAAKKEKKNCQVRIYLFIFLLIVESKNKNAKLSFI